MHRDGLAGSWGGHAGVSVACTVVGVLLSVLGPSWGSLALLAAIYGLLLWWRERSMQLVYISAFVVATTWLLWLPPPIIGGWLGSLVAIVFYIEREEANKRTLFSRDSYTLEKRFDKVGDVVGPVTNFLTASVLAVAWLLL